MEAEFGIGLVTGDVMRNLSASCLVMTTEVLLGYPASKHPFKPHIRRFSDPGSIVVPRSCEKSLGLSSMRFTTCVTNSVVLSGKKLSSSFRILCAMSFSLPPYPMRCNSVNGSVARMNNHATLSMLTFDQHHYNIISSLPWWGHISSAQWEGRVSWGQFFQSHGDATRARRWGRCRHQVQGPNTLSVFNFPSATTYYPNVWDQSPTQHRSNLSKSPTQGMVSTHSIIY